jgi:hypothetical protein
VRRDLGGVDMLVKAELSTTPIAVKTGRYRDKIIAHGEAANIFDNSDPKRKILVTIVQRPEGSVTISLLVPDKSGDRVIEMPMEKVKEPRAGDDSQEN